MLVLVLISDNAAGKGEYALVVLICLKILPAIFPLWPSPINGGARGGLPGRPMPVMR
ncbi:hypothetical protein KOXY103107_16740 [Komagataeibacter xylinus]